MYQTCGSQVAENRQSEGIQPATIKEGKNKKIKEIYIRTCAREGHGIAAGNKIPSRRTGFTNFDQRDYDFDVLEQQLLHSQEV